jgi:hypothetical protein
LIVDGGNDFGFPLSAINFHLSTNSPTSPSREG